MAHPKGALIERLQKEGRQPRFEARTSGPDHEPVFDAEVIVDGDVLGRGRGPNKRTAERRAAEEALAALDAAPAKGGSRGRGRRGKAPAPEAAEAEPAEAEPVADEADDEGSFEGPWPVFEQVLATSLRIAHDRIAAGLATDDAREAIETFALDLYKGVLQDLGEIVEVEEEPARSRAQRSIRLRSALAFSCTNRRRRRSPPGMSPPCASIISTIFAPKARSGTVVGRSEAFTASGGSRISRPGSSPPRSGSIRTSTSP